MSGGDNDFDRHAEAMPGLDRLARQRVWPYGCWLWCSLDATQRRGLSRRELLVLLGIGMCAQSMLSLLWLGEATDGSELDDLTRTTLVSVAEANVNSVLLVRLILATGLRPYRIPPSVRLAAWLASWLPVRGVHRGLRPLLDEYAAMHARDPGPAPTAALRLLTGVRHLATAREDLIEAMKSPGPMVNSLQRWALSAATAAAQARATHPTVYRGAGLAE